VTVRSWLLSAAVLLGMALAGACGMTGVAFAAGDVNEASCPNEALVGFEEYLPDCRGYEMVTPAFKGGAGITLKGISSDGSRVIGASFAAFAGDEARDENGTEVVYELTRLGSGWVVSAIDPPASLFPAQNFLGASVDLKKTLWVGRGPSQPVDGEDLYVREEDGALVEVGPVLSPDVASGPPAYGWNVAPSTQKRVVYAGASDDLSRVFFYLEPIDRDLWPGDTTGEEELKIYSNSGGVFSLYEYAGAGSTRPMLVGVNNEGHLISSCGTGIGDYQTEGSIADTYNAVSADGETVFFTSLAAGSLCKDGPPVNELYARVGRSETVDISEPSSADCERCQTGVRAPARFQGASEDGSKVVFTTGQELLPGDTQGNLYEYDFDSPAGQRILRVTGSSLASLTPEVFGVARVSMDGSHVYFVAGGVLSEGPNAEGNQPVPGAPNLYVFERDARYPAGHVAFIATLSSEDSADWMEEDDRPVQATPDGRFLVFDSVADLTPGDTSTQGQVFEYDALQEKLVRVSVGASGYAAGTVNAEAHRSTIEYMDFTGSGVVEGFSAASYLGVSASADGSTVVFRSSAGLTPGSEEGVSGVYEYRSSGAIADGNVYLVSGGAGASGASSPSVSASGDDVFFRTFAQVLPQDTDTAEDVYDARVGGGVAASAASSCVGEACRGGLAAAPSFGGSGSAGVQGGGGVAVAPVGVVPAPSSSGGGVVAPRGLTRAQKLARALRACKSKRGRSRRVCEADARKRYGAKAKSSRGRAAR
jgi:hypothetical protein